MRKVFLTALILIMALTAATTFAQSAEWYVNKPISEIRFVGLNNIDPSELEAITDQFINKKFTDTLFWDLQSKLYSLNYFDGFTANALPADDEKSSVIIEFTVTERPLIKTINIRGNLSITRSKILEVTTLKKDDILNNAKIRLDESAIKKLYVEEGYADATVTSSVEDSAEKGYVDLFYTVAEGTQTKINSISFSGNTFASDSTLKGQLESKEQSFFSQGIFQESLIEKDKAAIGKYYHDAGYIDMKIVDVVVNDAERDNDTERNYVDLIFYIDEGEMWTFGGFNFEGNTLFSDEELLATTKSKPGKSINMTRLQGDFIAIGDKYYNDGYIYNNIQTNEVRNAETHEISYNIVIDEKNRAHIENIIIKGNEKTKDHVILREIPLEVGDVFSKSAIMQGLNNLYNTRYFSSVVPDTPYGSEMGLMDLVINVEEQNTTDIQFGLTFTGQAGAIPIIGFLKWNDSNFMGEGQSINTGIEISPSTQKISFGYNDDWLFDQRITGGFDVSFSHDQYTSVEQDIMLPIFNVDDSVNDQVVPDPYDGHWVNASTGAAVEGTPDANGQIGGVDVLTDYDYAKANETSTNPAIDSSYLMDYESYTLSLSGNGGYTFHTPVGRVALGGGLSTALSYLYYDSSLYRPYDKDIRDALGVLNLTDKLWLTASWDTRDLIYSPTSGFILKETFSYVGGLLFGSKNYMKTQTDADIYFKLFDFPVTDEWNFSSVFGLHGQYSMILPQFGLMDNEWKWDVGGATRSDLLYYDGMFIARGWGTNYDNRALLDLAADLTTPLLPGMLSWNTFLSGTAVWANLEDIPQTTINDFYFTLGTGLQIDIPSFPISFFLAKRGKFTDTGFALQHGSYFGTTDTTDDTGFDFVITFDLDYF